MGIIAQTSDKHIIVAGPNGSGKTTVAKEIIEYQHFRYLSADDIAYEISPSNPLSASPITLSKEPQVTYVVAHAFAADFEDTCMRDKFGYIWTGKILCSALGVTYFLPGAGIGARVGLRTTYHWESP